MHVANMATFLNKNVRRMGRKMVPHVKDNNPLGMQKTVSLDFDEE